MDKEKRTHRRVKPKGLRAGVRFNSADHDQEISLDADILDISYSGIRVRLKEPISSEIIGHIKITMTLPESGNAFSVHGILKHQQPNTEFGLHYVDHIDGSIDDVMFECIELDESTVFIRTH